MRPWLPPEVFLTVAPELTDEQLDAALDDLVQLGYAEVKGTGRRRRFRLTPAGAERVEALGKMRGIDVPKLRDECKTPLEFVERMNAGEVKH